MSEEDKYVLAVLSLKKIGRLWPKKAIKAKVLCKRQLYKYKKAGFASQKHKKIKNVGIHAKNITQGRVQSSAFDFLRLTRLLPICAYCNDISFAKRKFETA